MKLKRIRKKKKKKTINKGVDYKCWIIKLEQMKKESKKLLQ